MKQTELFLKEVKSETTRKMLSRIPDDKFNWQPQPSADEGF